MVALVTMATTLTIADRAGGIDTASAADHDAESQAIWDEFESEPSFAPTDEDFSLLQGTDDATEESRFGATGEAGVVDLRWAQRRLLALGYWHSGVDGKVGLTTTQAVMAFQKVSGIARDGVLGAKTAAALTHATRPVASGRVTNGIEIDKARQVLFVVRNSKVVYVINVSTGSGQWYEQDGEQHRAVTPSGSFRVFRQIDRMHESPLGFLFRPKFFNGGIAIHGSASIPGYPASHGCVRVSNPAMNLIWRQKLAEIGSRVVVY